MSKDRISMVSSKHHSDRSESIDRVYTFLLIDQEVHVGVDGDDDYVGEDVSTSNEVKGIRVLHRNSLGDLHHPKDDDQVGSGVLSVPSAGRRGRFSIHLRADCHFDGWGSIARLYARGLDNRNEDRN